MKTNSKRSVDAAANYIDSLYNEGKHSIFLQTFDGEQYQGTILEQEVHQYAPLKVFITLIDHITSEYLSFDLSDVAIIQPVA
jgi:hypothetical protein